jgi:predicted regulator of Ras-like GTPase activity (Roadblock/LC7/MglB family)
VAGGLHPASSILDDLTRGLPLIACFLLDGGGAVRAMSRGPAEGFEAGVLAASVEAALEAAGGLLRVAGEARIDGVFVEGGATHAFVRPFGEGAIVAVFDAAQTTFGAVRMALRRQTEPLALLVQVEAAPERIDRRAVRRLLARL